jgi:hypothetical protein
LRWRKSSATGELLDLQWIPLPEDSLLPVAEVPRFMLAHTINLLKAPDPIPGCPVFSYSARPPQVAVRFETRIAYAVPHPDVLSQGR